MYKNCVLFAHDVVYYALCRAAKSRMNVLLADCSACSVCCWLASRVMLAIRSATPVSLSAAVASLATSSSP